LWNYTEQRKYEVLGEKLVSMSVWTPQISSGGAGERTRASCGERQEAKYLRCGMAFKSKE
jgi:hypothetical protein